METCSSGSPLMMAASLAFALFLALSSSLAQSQSQSQSVAGKPPLPPSKLHPSPPPKQVAGHHQTPPAKKTNGHHQAPPPDQSKGLNTGKIVGLVFSGIALALQIGVVAYLTYKRFRLYHHVPA